MSEHVQVTHFVDPGCPWDYSAEPVRVALEQRYGEQLAWRNVQVGLYESAAAVAARGYTTTGQAESYRIFQERHGMPFCTEERPRLQGTWPAARASKAAERQDPALGAALLRRLRLAWFVEGRVLDQRDELQLIAAQVAGLVVPPGASHALQNGSGAAREVSGTRSMSRGKEEMPRLLAGLRARAICVSRAAGWRPRTRGASDCSTCCGRRSCWTSATRHGCARSSTSTPATSHGRRSPASTRSASARAPSALAN